MATEIRTELSEKNPNRLPEGKERFLELKHFCHQYNYWKSALPELTSLEQSHIELVKRHQEGEHSDPVVQCAAKREQYLHNIEIIEKAAKEAAGDIDKYLLVGVTRGQKYGILKARLDIPCGEDKYYKMYRRFFKILSDLRG